MAHNVIVSCESYSLTDNEKSLFADLQPWGLILFSRNIENPSQVKKLVEQCRQAVGRNDMLVFVDQEGGRVSRLPNSYWRVPPSPTKFAQMYFSNQAASKRACFLNALLTAIELKAIGINVNCAPMLDLPQANADAIVTERALGNQPSQVIDLGTEIINGFKTAGVAPVIKHMPGHGRATCDSHLSLPIVEATLQALEEWDFLPFKAFANEAMAMTAHIVFNKIDNKVATQSDVIINDIMRKRIGFNGIIMTDDVNMQALNGNIQSRVKASLAAGCDIALHCSGKFEEMKALIDVTSELSGQSLERATEAEKLAFADAGKHDEQSIKDELNSLLNNSL